MKTKTKLVMITGMFVLAMAMAGTPASAGKDKCIDYKFLFDDGHIMEGTCHDSNNVKDGHVPELHISCSDEFPEGVNQKGDLAGHLVEQFYIVKQSDKEDKPDKTCGTPFEVPEEPDCDDFNLQAEALDGGSIRLTMNALPMADEYRIWKAVGGGDLAPLATAPSTATEFVDDDTEIGMSYHYAVEIVKDGRVLDTCHVEITSVPVFGNILASGLAIGLGMLAYVGARRRS